MECKLEKVPTVIEVLTVLIETYWNVNNISEETMVGTISINRNILECKCIIRYRFDVMKKVLIETYWNVNINAYNLIWNEWFVLIETYWNVNALASIIVNQQNKY